MKKPLGLIALAIILTCLSVPAKADPITFVATLTSSQEVPSNASPAIGFATLILNDDGTATFSMSFSGLTTNETAAHIHGPAPPGVNAGVLIPLPLGQISNLQLTLTPQQVGFLQAGQLYINVHTSRFPGGEIRGQLQVIPEPGTSVLLASGLLSLAGAAIRRRRK
jgi:hypothetical protein